jgi:beta-glucanase (GH16 family)
MAVVIVLVGPAFQAGGQALADPVDHRVIAVEEADFCEHGEWHLVFEDEFNGPDLDTLTWLRFYPYCYNYDDCLGSRTHGLPDELQIFRDENVQLTENGTVQLVLRKGPVGSWFSFSSVYTSGLLHSRIQFGRGRFECRCRILKSSSRYITSAFWLFGGGQACSEIDIMEQLWAAGRLSPRPTQVQ